jgi:hypothetical protein
VSGVNFYYVDDSGDETCTLLTALEIPVDRWSVCLRTWLGWRKALFRKHHLPTDFEIHSSEFLQGKGEPAPVVEGEKAPLINTSRGLRREIFESSLAQIARTPGLRMLTIYRDDTEKMLLYRDLLAWIEDEARIDSTHAIMIVDGIEKRYRMEHRALKLRTRVVVEDVWMQDSVHSQLIQMADMAVHAAFQRAVRNPDKTFMWEWYSRHLLSVAYDEGNAHPTLIRGL